MQKVIGRPMVTGCLRSWHESKALRHKGTGEVWHLFCVLPHPASTQRWTFPPLPPEILALGSLPVLDAPSEDSSRACLNVCSGESCSGKRPPSEEEMRKELPRGWPVRKTSGCFWCQSYIRVREKTQPWGSCLSNSKFHFLKPKNRWVTLRMKKLGSPQLLFWCWGIQTGLGKTSSCRPMTEANSFCTCNQFTNAVKVAM